MNMEQTFVIPKLSAQWWNGQENQKQMAWPSVK